MGHLGGDGGRVPYPPNQERSKRKGAQCAGFLLSCTPAFTYHDFCPIIVTQIVKRVAMFFAPDPSASSTGLTWGGPCLGMWEI